MERSPADYFRFFCSVKKISNERMANGSHVNANLMGASRGQFQRQKGAVFCAGQHLIIGQSRRTIGTDFPLQNAVFLASDGGVYGTL